MTPSHEANLAGVGRAPGSATGRLTGGAYAARVWATASMKRPNRGD